MTSAAAWTPQTIPWQEISPDGTKYALLEGSREGGLFTYAFFLPSGFWDGAHWHSTDARIIVASGCLYLGHGEHLNTTQAKAYGAGSVLIVPAELRHYDGAKEATLIIGMATAPLPNPPAAVLHSLSLPESYGRVAMSGRSCPKRPPAP